MKNLFFLFSILITTNYFGQFANNPCSAGNLTNSCVSNTISLTTAFSNSGVADPTIENGTGCSSVGSDATAGTITDYDGWYTTVADASGNISVYATIVSGDPVVGVYSGTCGSLTLLGCDDDGGSGLDANINLTGLTAGQTLFIRVWDYAGGTGTYEVTSTGGTPPANDDCAGATGLTLNNAPINGTTYCATVETTDWNDCESNTENNVWYSFTTPSNGDITVNLTAIACFGSGAGVDVSVFAGNCSAFTTNGCLAMSSGGSGSVPTFTGPAGTYYVMIDGDNDGSATALCDFDVDVDFTADPCAAGGSGTPINDDCANAATLTENAAPISGTVYCATTEATDWNDCESNTENNVWYTFTATGNGNVNVNVFPNNCFDINTNLDVSIFTGNCASFSGLSCGTVGGGTNAISFIASIGTTYYIMVDGDNVTSTSNCDFNIDVDFSLSCPTAGYTDFDFGTGTGTLLAANNPYDCNTQTWLWANDSASSNGEITPGLMVVFDGATLDLYSDTEASLNIHFDDGLGGGMQLYGSLGVGNFPQGPTGNFTVYLDHMDPTWTWYVEICDAWGDGTPSFYIEDIVTGAIITPTTTANFDAIPGTGSTECILYPIAPNTLTSVVTWSISPAVAANAFVPFPDGSAYLNTAAMVAGTYNITYSFDDGLGCTSSSTQTLIVGPAATAIYFSDSLCGDAANNASFNLTTLNNIVNGGTGQTVYWTDLAFTPVGSETVYTVNSSASPDSVIAVIEHGTSQCLAASLVELTVTESPTTNISPDPANICAGMPLTVSSNASGGTGGLAINWTGTGSGSLDNTSSSSPTFTNAVAGNYNLTATVTDNVGCTGNDILSITVDPLPTVTSAASVCVNGNITLTPTAGGTWISNDPSVATITNGGVVTGVAAGSTTFTFTNTTTNCSNTTNSVTVNPLPTATASNNGPVCIGASLSLTGGTAGLSYSWSGPNTFSNATQSPTVSASATASMAGVYTITTTDGNSCSATATTTVTLNPLPTATASNNGPVCVGDALSLTGGAAGLSYSWSGPNTFTNGTQSPTVSAAATAAMGGTYTITVTDANLCTATATTNVVVNALPAATATSNSPVCEGSSLTLTGGAVGMSYSWSGPNTYTNGTQSPTVSASVTSAMGGAYTITVTDGNTCSSTATTNVVINPLPTATASNNGPVCIGTSLSLTGGAAGLSYSWTGPNTFSSTAQSPTVSASATSAMSGVYTLTVTDGNTCSSTATTAVSLNSLPTATATNNGPVCDGDSLSLTGGAAGLSYSWSGPSSYTNGTQSPAVSVAATAAIGGVYTITVTDGNLCTATATTTVIINALPTATAASNSPVCEGSSLTLTGGAAGMSYSWSGPNTYTNGTQSPTVSGSATSAMAGTYTITVTDGNICSATATTDVIVNSLPTATASNNGPVCDNSQLDLTGGAAGLSYSWSGPSAYTNGNQSPTVSANTTAAMGGIYTLTVTDGNTCTATATTTVTVNPLPTATASNNGPICEGTALSLTGGAAGLSYSWSGPNAFSNTSQSPSISSSATTAMSGIYTLTVTDANSCSTTATTNVTVNSLPTIDDSGISLTNPTSCGASDGSITGLVGSGSAPITYAWNGGTAQPSPDNTGIPSGSYNVVISDVTGCTNNYGPYSLSDPSSPPAPVTTLAPGPICIGGSVSISVDSPVGGATYTWSGPGGFSSAGTSITINPLSATDAGSYDVFATIAGCVGAGSVPNVIVVNPLPVADVLIPLTVDCNNPVIGLDGSNSEQGADITYLWTTTSALIGAINLDTAATSTAGNYGLLVTNTTTGCTNNTNVTVNENFDTPISNLTVNNGGLIDCINTSLTIDGSTSTNQAGGTTGLTFNWSTTSGGSSIGSGTSLSVNSAGTYYLLVTEISSGCTSESNTIITQDANVPTADPGTSPDLDCNNVTLTLDGTNSTGTSLSYAWSATLGGNIVSGATTDSPLIDAPGSYSLTVTAANGCTNTASIIISEDITQPNVSVISPLVVDCNNTIVNLDGSASSQGTNFAYNWTTATGTIIGLTTLDTAATSETGTYNLEVTDSNNGCSANANISVSVDTISPNAEAGADVNFPCGVTSVSIDGSASSGTGISYLWSGSGNITNGGTSIADVDQTGPFYLTVTGSNGCSAIDSLVVIPDSNLPAADAGTDIVIDCNNTLPVTLDGSSSEIGATITYLWSTSGTGNITGGTTTSPSVDNEGTYSIQVTNTSNGCIANASVLITMDTISPVSIPGIDTTISCLNGGITILDGSASTGTGLTYSWSTLNGNIISQTSSNADINLDGAYTLTVTASNGCSDTSPINVTMDTLTPVISIPVVGSLNCNSTDLSIDASSSISSGGTYLWTTSNGNIISGTNTSTVTVDQIGDYTLTITNNNGCTQTSLTNVSGTPNPIADFNTTPINGQIPLIVDYIDNSSGTGLIYSWTFGDGSSDTISSPSNTFNSIGSFTTILTIEDSNGCTDTASIIITVGGESYLNIPNIFSPNGDGNNDQFNLDGNNITEIHGLIMNRWGQVIYEWDGIKSGWDGYTIAGIEASEGTYYYIIDALGADGIIYNHTGNFQLVK